MRGVKALFTPRGGKPDQPRPPAPWATDSTTAGPTADGGAERTAALAGTTSLAGANSLATWMLGSPRAADGNDDTSAAGSGGGGSSRP